jgi:molybdate transport system substrate-binding protein
MSSCARRAFGLFLGLAAAVAAKHAAAETLIVFAAGAVKAAVGELIPVFEAAGGDKIQPQYDTVGALRDRALAGEAAHVVLLSAPAIAAIGDRGLLVAGTRQPVGRTGIGLAGPLGSATRIATPADFVAVLKNAKSIGYADPARGATAGTHFSKVLAELGLAEPLKDRLKLYPFGVETIAAVAKGELEIGVSQATEIVAHPGEVAFLGLFPEPYNIWTPYEAAALRDTPAARRLLALLSSDCARNAFARSGFETAK